MVRLSRICYVWIYIYGRFGRSDIYAALTKVNGLKHTFALHGHELNDHSEPHYFKYNVVMTSEPFLELCLRKKYSEQQKRNKEKRC